jgi:hypothetical protein
MTFTADDSADTSQVVDLRDCNTTTECPRTPADEAGVTPLFLIGVLIPVLCVCLLAFLARRP